MNDKECTVTTIRNNPGIFYEATKANCERQKGPRTHPYGN